MSGRHSDPAVQLLLDRLAVRQVIDRYAAGVDRRDFDLVASCFAADVNAQAWGFTDRDRLVEFISGVSHFHTTMHMMGNDFIELTGDEASLDVYAMLTHHADAADGTVTELNMSGNRYVEKLRRTSDGWVIVQRGGDPVWAPTGVSGVTTDDPQVRWLLDRAELHDLMMQYALGIDLREYDRIAACFARDFHAAYGPAEFDDIDQLLAFIKGVEFFVSTTHFLGTQLAEIDGDVAGLETYAMITHREERDGGPHEWMAGGSSYVDELARVNGRWLITERGDRARRVASSPPSVRSSDDPAVQALLDRAAIHDVIATSALAVDRRDWALLEACFAADARIDEVRRAVERHHSTCHFLGNQLIELDGDEASVETYLYLTHRESESAMASPWSDGARRFVDRLVRRSDGWRIAERQLLDNRVRQSTSA